MQLTNCGVLVILIGVLSRDGKSSDTGIKHATPLIGGILAMKRLENDAVNINNSEKSKSLLFGELDDDRNGVLSIDELKEFVTETGGNSLDDESEIAEAVAHMMTELDDNKDERINMEDLTTRWSNIAHLLSSAEVLDWLQHSQQLPNEVLSAFERNSITGYDFPELLEDNGLLLETQLNVTQPTMKARIVRGMRMKLLAMGRPPVKPYSSAKSRKCSSITLQWKHGGGAHDLSLPVHKYLLQRRHSRPPERGWFVNWTAGETHQWRTVYDGLETSFEDLNLEPHKSYSYRLSAWNLIGRSDYEYIEETTVREPCDKISMRSWWNVFEGIERILEWTCAIATIMIMYYSLHRDAASEFKVLSRIGLTSPPRPPSPLSLRLSPERISRNKARSITFSFPDSVSSDLSLCQLTTAPIRFNSRVCAVCKLEFTFLERKLSRHTCAKCHHKFHKWCGTTDHRFLECPVDGRCCCSICENAAPSMTEQ